MSVRRQEGQTKNGAAEIRLNGAVLSADPSGALLWPARETLVVADLHLEKGSAFAARGQFLPPYDTRATLGRLEGLVSKHRPKRVICLGDSFHDGGAGERLAAADRARLRRLTAACDWVWIEGNHDPEPPDDLGGRIEAELIDELIGLAALAPSVGVGVDFSDEALGRARGRHPDLRFVYADVHELDLDETFDVIILSDLINDLWDVQTVLQRVARYATPRTRLPTRSPASAAMNDTPRR